MKKINLKRVIQEMRKFYPAMKDYNVIDESDECYAEILDKKDHCIAVISESELTKFMNLAEQGTKKRNPKLWLMCGQHVTASTDKCTDLKGHCFTEYEYARPLNKTIRNYSKEPMTKKESLEGIQATHTEDCIDANDDTSVLKGKCICPKPTHTPTPWKQDKVEWWNFDIAASDEHFMSIAFPEWVEPSERRANAAFIRRAVNAHEELLTALKRIQNAFGYGDQRTEDDRIVDGWDQVKVRNLVLEIAGNAIAKVEGK